MMLALKLKPAIHLENLLSFIKMMKKSIWLCLDIYCFFVFYDEITIPDILIFSISHLGVALSSAIKNYQSRFILSKSTLIFTYKA